MQVNKINMYRFCLPFPPFPAYFSVEFPVYTYQCDSVSKIFLNKISIYKNTFKLQNNAEWMFTLKAPRKKNASEIVVCWSRLLQIIA